MGDWGAAAVGSLATALLLGAGAFAVKLYRARGGFAKDTAAATVAVSAEERKARREQEDAALAARRADEDAERKQESAILKEYKQLAAEQREEIAEHRDLVHKLRDQMHAMGLQFAKDLHQMGKELAACRQGRAKADERIASLEDALTQAKIPHRTWHPESDDGSGDHRPLQGGEQ
jgi:hypothetical protein